VAVESLRRQGKYNGDIVVITDNPNKMVETIHKDITSKVRCVEYFGKDLLDYTTARYKIDLINDIEKYRPVVYLDSDVLCTCPIRELLVQVLKSDHIHFNYELSLLHPDDYYGASLLEADKIEVEPGVAGISTGVIGFPHAKNIKYLFSQLMELVPLIAETKGSRTWSPFFDQPVFNYLIVKHGIVGNPLSPWVENLLGSFHGLEVADRKTLVHFCGGVGAGERKIDAMKHLFEALRRREDQTVGWFRRSANRLLAKSAVLPRR
jgi:hypothetical protein